MRVEWQCEINPFCQAVLRFHWPDVLLFDDVRALPGSAPGVDVLCGGFPCQPVSLAGLGKAQDDERWLWPEYAAVIRDVRPRYVIVENVPGLLGRGMGDVLGDLSALGYDAEWDCVPASAVGAPHQRDRVWIVAYPTGQGNWSHARAAHGDARGDGSNGTELAGRSGPDVADADEERRDWRPRVFGPEWRTELEDRRRAVQDADGSAVFARWQRGRAPQAGSAEWWAVEPPVPRVAHGVPARLDQLAALGNAVVPVIPELIGRRILAWEATGTQNGRRGGVDG
jgi:DNA (cytosine-5)-methyltransferase 1